MKVLVTVLRLVLDDDEEAVAPSTRAVPAREGCCVNKRGEIKQGKGKKEDEMNMNLLSSVDVSHDDVNVAVGCPPSMVAVPLAGRGRVRVEWTSRTVYEEDEDEEVVVSAPGRPVASTVCVDKILEISSSDDDEAVTETVTVFLVVRVVRVVPCTVVVRVLVGVTVSVTVSVSDEDEDKVVDEEGVAHGSDRVTVMV